MDESWFRLISLIVATGIFGIIHWTISKHIKDGSERKVILWVENVVMVCLLGAFVKGEPSSVRKLRTRQPFLVSRSWHT